MAITVSLINMKGGVGKSTLTVNLAWHLADFLFGKRVLVVDLDPQFNASQYLLGQSEYERLLRNRHPTVWDIFEQITSTPADPSPVVDATRCICNRVNFPTGGKIDLIPSRLELALSLRTPFHNKETMLARTISQLKDKYDVILIDCAPTESMLTTAAYLVSDYLLVPVKPEYLSTIGLPLLVNSMNTFRDSYKDHRLDLAGIVFNGTTEYSPEERLAKQEVRQIAMQNQWFVFESEVTYSRSYPKGARVGMPINRTDRARRSQKRRFSLFAGEFAQRIGL